MSSQNLTPNPSQILILCVASLEFNFIKKKSETADDRNLFPKKCPATQRNKIIDKYKNIEEQGLIAQCVSDIIRLGSPRPSKISPIFQAHLEFDLRDAQIFFGFQQQLTS